MFKVQRFGGSNTHLAIGYGSTKFEKPVHCRIVPYSLRISPFLNGPYAVHNYLSQ